MPADVLQASGDVSWTVTDTGLNNGTAVDTLSGVERPNFAGRLKPQYEKWMAERRELNRETRPLYAGSVVARRERQGDGTDFTGKNAADLTASRR